MNDSQDEPLDSAVTPELFREWRSPRFGRSNPERLNNPVWEWLVRSKLNAYSANQKFGRLDPMNAGPCWCFDRIGQSSTPVADGRIVLIAGEHEDYYDPDFYIYNDVVVLDQDGRIEILGYPREDFPPTDFHTATLVGNRLIMIGNLGYPEERKPGITPVMVLDLHSLVISAAVTSGTPPGWLHGHSAALSKDGNTVVVRHGKLDRGGGVRSLVENIDDWRLHLADWRWERLTDRRWQQWEIRRKDGKRNHLWEIQQALWARDVNRRREFEKYMEQLAEELGARPDPDIAANLYCPQLPHAPMPELEDEYRVFRIQVDGVVVRYVEDMYSIQITVEGELPRPAIDALASDLRDKLTALENAPCESKPL